MAYKYIKGKNKIRGEQTFIDNLSGSQIISASYFVGDGSLLTNLSASNGGGGISSVYTSGSITGSGLISNPVILKDPLVIGTVTASIGFSGNLYGTASYATQALTASYAVNSGLTTVSTSGSITGSGIPIDPVVLKDPLIIGIVTASIGFSGNLYGTASYATNANSVDGIDSTGFAILTASNQFTNNNTISGNLTVTGGLSIGNYIQMLPVAPITIPTNQTASYIYTSGSTNDLYFTQYQPGTNFTNTTRLRWLEGGLSTGLLHGGIVTTVNGTQTFNISSGSGIIVSYNASTTTDPYPTIKQVSWNNFVSQSLIYSSSAQITYVSIDENGAIIQSPTAPTFTQFKDRIVLGRVVHQTGSVTNGATNTPPTAYAVNSNVADFTRAFGPLKLNGHFLQASGSAPTLSLKKSAGSAYVEGRNYANNPNIPNIVLASDDPAVTISKIYYEYVNSSGQVVIDTGIGNAGYTVIDPTRYNNNGILTSTSPSKYTIQRVYWFPRAVNRALFVYFGNTEYGSLAEAVNGIQSENFTEGDNTAGSAILVGYICVKGNATSLLTAAEATIIQGGLFRGNTGGGGGSAALTTPGGSNHQIQFNDSGAFGGSTNLTFDGSTFGLTGSMNVSGNINFDGYTLSGSIAQFSNLTASTIINNGGFVAKRTVVTGNISLNSSQYIIAVDTNTATGSVLITLPNASVLSNGQIYIIKDEGGLADTKNIIINCSSGQIIDGSPSISLESPYAAVNIYCNGVDRYFVY